MKSPEVVILHNFRVYCVSVVFNVLNKMSLIFRSLNVVYCNGRKKKLLLYWLSAGYTSFSFDSVADLLYLPYKSMLCVYVT